MSLAGEEAPAATVRHVVRGSSPALLGRSRRAAGTAPDIAPLSRATDREDPALPRRSDPAEQTGRPRTDAGAPPCFGPVGEPGNPPGGATCAPPGSAAACFDRHRGQRIGRGAASGNAAAAAEPELMRPARMRRVAIS